MSRYSTMPTLIDELRSFTLADLKKLGYLKKNSFVSGNMNWLNRYDEVTSSINVAVKNSDINMYLELDYNYRGEEMNYRVNIVKTPSNLGKGQVLYFMCPFTYQRCRKLHLINGKFMHRSALNNPLYSKQIESKHWRDIEKRLSIPFELDKLYDKLFSKNFKKYYRDKPTKRFRKLLKQIEILENRANTY